MNSIETTTVWLWQVPAYRADGWKRTGGLVRWRMSRVRSDLAEIVHNTLMTRSSRATESILKGNALLDRLQARNG